MSANKYVTVVHGLMIKNGTVVPYGTEVEDETHVDNATQKVKDGFLLSKHDFDAKVKGDNEATGEVEVKKSDDSGEEDDAKEKKAPKKLI